MREWKDQSAATGGGIILGKNRAWRKWELDQIRAEYHYRSSEDLAEELNRTVNAINLKASRLGLKKPFLVDDPRDLEFLKCWGVAFEEPCIDKCPGWYECLSKFSELAKQDIVLEYRLQRVTIKGQATGPQIVQAIRQAIK